MVDETFVQVFSGNEFGLNTIILGNDGRKPVKLLFFLSEYHHFIPILLF